MTNFKNLLIITIASFLLLACGEDQKTLIIDSNNPERTGDVRFTLNVQASDMTVCNQLGYTETLFFTDNNSKGLSDFDEVNYLKIYKLNGTYQRTNTVVYEYEDSSNSQWPVQSNSYRAFFHHELRQLLFEEACVYDLVEGEF